MDEDYDAVDLENWFLAMQSADGSVIIPSFHRPAAIRIDTANGYDDWGGPSNTAPNWADSASRILRPRKADGHDAGTFPDLVPNATTGKITYDVDNDGDGQTDSVWVDLGYPARRNAQSQLYKPLFAFMVIGLNGRIPLNTAGNLAGGGPGSGGTHAAHLGNSVSEIDPTYALQNGFLGYATDGSAYLNPISGVLPYPAPDGQVDSGGLDVRLTQLRNILTGTRPQNNPGTPGYAPGSPDLTGQTNGDNNFVLIGSQPYFMPNSVADIGDVDMNGTSPPQAGVLRINPPVAGRWGEAQSVHGYPVYNPNGPPFNLVVPAFNNRIRAGYSMDITDLENGIPRDAADDNLNSFDPYPPISATNNRLGEVGDLDFLDPAGAFLLPVERLRRYVTPGDINGTGRIVQWDGTNKQAGPNAGADQWGRVLFSSYFRPPGLPGVVAPSTGATPGAVTFPWTSAEAYPTTMVTNNVAATPPNTPGQQQSAARPRGAAVSEPQLQYHGQYQADPAARRRRADRPESESEPEQPGAGQAAHLRRRRQRQGQLRRPERGRRDEPVRAQRAARLALRLWRSRVALPPAGRRRRLAGLSFVSARAGQLPNPVDGLRRRRLFALDSWEMNNFAWTNDNPGSSAFAYNARFKGNVDAGFTTLNTAAAANPNISTLPNPTNAAPSPTPSLAQRDKKINLNYPLPVSNDPNEPVRQKWISDTYQTLKAILPPRAVDTAEELAQLSQYVINIVDFRDTDATMTHWQNPDSSCAPAPAPPTRSRCFWPPGRRRMFRPTSMAWSTTRSPSTR